MICSLMKKKRITKHVYLQTVAVYGVKVDGYDGKVGMATVMLNVGLTKPDFDNIISAYQRDLPSYARPLFIRITEKIPLTSTFKHKKNILADEVSVYDRSSYVTIRIYCKIY